DLAERKRWREYMDAYEDLIRRTATRHAPWYVVPADHKWFTRLVVAAAIVDALSGLDLKRPPLSAEQQKAIKAARASLPRRERWPRRAGSARPARAPAGATGAAAPLDAGRAAQVDPTAIAGTALRRRPAIARLRDRDRGLRRRRRFALHARRPARRIEDF